MPKTASTQITVIGIDSPTFLVCMRVAGDRCEAVFGLVAPASLG
jgi:hypothetical protein